MSKSKTFDGRRVAAQMTKKGLTPTTLGARIGVSGRSIENYRSGNEPRSYVVLCALANALGVQVDDLFTKGGK